MEIRLHWGWGRIRLHFLKFTLVKKSDQHTSTYSASNQKDIIDLDGGTVSVQLPVKVNKRDFVVLGSAKLKIPAAALGEHGAVHTISVEANGGRSLGDVEIVFGPSGTAFNPAARLEIVLYDDVSAEDIKRATHIHGYVQVESISVEATDRGQKTVVLISVPGFSRYGIDDDDRTDDDDPYLDWY